MGELDGVAQQVDEHLAQLALVAMHLHGHLCAALQLHMQALGLGTQTENFGHIVQQQVQVEIRQVELQPPGFDFGQVKDVVDQAQQVLAAAGNGVNLLLLVRIQCLVALQNLRKTDDGVERCADFVAHVGQEGALGLVGGFGCFLGQGQLGGAGLLHAAHGLLGLNAGMALVHQAQCLRRDFAVHVQHRLDQGGGGPLHFCVSPLVGLGQRQALFHGLGCFGHAFVAVENVESQPTAEVAEQIIQHFLKRALARLQVGNVLEKCPVALLVAVQVRVLTKGCEPHRFFGTEVVLGIVGQFAQNLACLRFGRSVNELLCHAVEQRHQCAVLGIHHVDAGFKVGIPGEDFKLGLASGGGCGVGGVGGRQCHDSVAGNGQTDIHGCGPF